MKRLLKRDEIEDRYKWSLADLFVSDDQWKCEYIEVNAKIGDILKYRGSLGDSAEVVFECLRYSEDLSKRIEKLYVYAHMRLHEDSTNSFYQGISKKADNILVKYSANSSFIEPELIELSSELLEQFKENNCLSEYVHYFNNLIRAKNHTLSPREEEILANTEKLAEAPENIFDMINNADIRFPNVLNEHGEEIELTKGRFVSLLKNKNQEVRKNAFEALYTTYGKQINTLAATYSASVKKDIFYSEMRKYESAQEMALFDDNIPTSVYSNLIQTVHEHLPTLHRYVKLRKKLLGVSQLHMYDLYVPIVSEFDMKINYEDACKIVTKSLEPLGAVYKENLTMGLTNRWIDVYENKGKRSGAYSWGTCTAHPYVLLNYENNIDSLFTLIHEMGHAMHSFYSWKTQPYVYSGHKIFTAEVASTVNEALLMEYLLNNTKDINEKKYLLNYFMDQFRGTLFRQVMFAEFEKITHEMAESDESLTPEVLNKIYHDLNVRYYGTDIIVDDLIDIEWARIPHFYNPFYVYQYATGYSAAIALSQKILKGEENAVQKYINFLSSGQSDYSINLLKNAGVDMTTSEPINNALTLFSKILDEMEI